MSDAAETGTPFPNLLSPLTIGAVTFRNRIFSTGHNTMLAEEGLIGARLMAYHEARAAGGAGLIVVQVAAVHDSAITTSRSLLALSDDCIDGYRRLAKMCRAHDCRVIAQLYHPGREVSHTDEGALRPAYAPSAVRTDRMKVAPRALSRTKIGEILEAFGAGARRLRVAGVDGVELVASHGYLPAQFLNPRLNRRDDDYGGSDEARRRFMLEALAAIRAELTPDMLVGMRISNDEKDPVGLTEDETLAAIASAEPLLDYVNVTLGSSASSGGALHIVPPMMVQTGYVAPFAERTRQRVSIPVFVAGRINQPQIAESILASGQADMCGMTRAMICDPELGNKTTDGRIDDIRACIGCNQACIGHFQIGCGISCIQHPETGRETRFGTRAPAAAPRRILVAGGGPGGMKAAAVAAERDHEVLLYEASGQLGGQALMAQLLPGRAEFGGIVTNLEREMALAGVRVIRNTAVDRALVAKEAPDAVIVATGARPSRPVLEGGDEGHVVDAWQVLAEKANVGKSVVIADWRCDWTGLGLAEKLARDGCRVRLAVNGLVPGERVPSGVRDMWNGILHELGVEVVTYANLFGIDADTVFFQHSVTQAPIVLEKVDTLVLAQGHDAVTSLEDELDGTGIEVRAVGDCVSPRTAEEAVYEGLLAGSAV